MVDVKTQEKISKELAQYESLVQPATEFVQKLKGMSEAEARKACHMAHVESVLCQVDAGLYGQSFTPEKLLKVNAEAYIAYKDSTPETMLQLLHDKIVELKNGDDKTPKQEKTPLERIQEMARLASSSCHIRRPAVQEEVQLLEERLHTLKEEQKTIEAAITKAAAALHALRAGHFGRMLENKQTIRTFMILKDIYDVHNFTRQVRYYAFTGEIPTAFVEARNVQLFRKAVDLDGVRVEMAYSEIQAFLSTVHKLGVKYRATELVVDCPVWITWEHGDD